jgi:hypothetical protein
MGLKAADSARTKRFERGEDLSYVKDPAGEEVYPKRERDGAWVELRVALSKREDGLISDSVTPDRVVTDDGVRLIGKPGGSGYAKTFELLAVAWDYSDGTPKVADYLGLDVEDSEWVDECLDRAVGIARGVKEENSDSPGTAAPQSSGHDSSAEEADQQPTT